METYISRLMPTVVVSRRALLRTATTAAAGLAGPTGPSDGTSAGSVDHSEHVHLVTGKKSLEETVSWAEGELQRIYKA